MDGKIALINPRTATVAVHTEKGDFTVCKLLGNYKIDLHDTLSGALDEPGHAVVNNVTKGLDIQLTVEHTGNSLLAAKRLLGV